MIIALPVTEDGQLNRGFGKTHWMAIADVSGGVISQWTVHEVNWDGLHDRSGHGAHHARIVSFMKDHQVDRVVFNSMGDPMVNTLTKLGVVLLQVSPAPARGLAQSASLVEVD